jgi:hypothetical protein
MQRTAAQRYSVPRLGSPLVVDGDWAKPPWPQVQPAWLGHFMGERPIHFPNTQVKVAYDRDHLYVIFRVKDRYIRAVSQGYQSPVYQDSCVEFFFTPSTDLSQGYFNLEAHCGGTLLFQHQTARGKDTIRIAEKDLDRIEVAHSLPRLITQEIQRPTTWTLGYRLPVSILENYAPVVRPCPGVVWKGNFYKCADQTSHPHWLTWSFIDRPQPDFHRPEYFGELLFDSGVIA